MKQILKRLTYANVMSSIAVFLVLGGGAAIAANQLAKNSVGKKQIKANAVTAVKIKKNAVTNKKLSKNAVDGSKVKDASLTGADINLATLGTVPSASVANTVPPSALHVVGAPGEPGFLSGSANYGTLSELAATPGASFLKDRDNIVHLEGVIKKGAGGPIPGTLFQLPAGFRPASGTIVVLEASEEQQLLIAGSNVVLPGPVDISGLVISQGEKENVILTGISFFSGS